MEELIVFSSFKPLNISDFEEAYFHSKRKYSINQLQISGDISEENLNDAIEKAQQICLLAGIRIHQHFQKLYVYEAKNGNVQIEYRLSKSAINLLMMQLSQLNENRAKWLWELAGR